MQTSHLLQSICSSCQAKVWTRCKLTSAWTQNKKVAQLIIECRKSRSTWRAYWRTVDKPEGAKSSRCKLNAQAIQNWLARSWSNDWRTSQKDKVWKRLGRRIRVADCFPTQLAQAPRCRSTHTMSYLTTQSATSTRAAIRDLVSNSAWRTRKLTRNRRRNRRISAQP